MGYNGWKNYQTWNVALWIGNDEGLYGLAREATLGDYTSLVESFREVDSLETPDRVAWNDSGLDTVALDKMLAELRD